MISKCRYHPNYDPKDKPQSGCMKCWQLYNWEHREGLQAIRENPIPKMPDKGRVAPRAQPLKIQKGTKGRYNK